MRFSWPVLACGLALSGLLSGAVAAQGSHAGPTQPAETPRSAAARARYPQPVRVGDLTGRQVLEDDQQQRVLGRVVAITRAEDGALSLLMDQGGVLGFGTRRVAVPVAAVALLGRYVVLKDLDAAALAALPEVTARRGVVPDDAIIRIGLARN